MAAINEIKNENYLIGYAEKFVLANCKHGKMHY